MKSRQLHTPWTPEGSQNASYEFRLAKVEVAYEQAINQIGELQATVKLLTARQGPDDIAFLHGIATVVKGCIFTTKSLRAHRCADASLHRLLRGYTLRELGATLRALRDRPLDGLVLRRLPKRENSGALWRVYVVDDRHHQP